MRKRLLAFSAAVFAAIVLLTPSYAHAQGNGIIHDARVFQAEK